MGHNSVVLGHPKSTGISWVDTLSMRPTDLGCQINNFCNSYLPFAKSFIKSEE